MAKLQTAQKSYGVCIGKQLAVADLTGSPSVFTITGGPIAVRQLGFMVTTLMAGANNLKFQHTVTGGSAADLCGNVDTDAGAVGQLYVIDGVKVTAATKVTDPGIAVYADIDHMPIILSTGTITAVFDSTSTAGAGVVFMEYTPLSQFTNVSIA